IRGWVVADCVRNRPADVIDILGDCAIAREASSDLLGWWIGADFAVYYEPRLTEYSGPVKNVLVYARDENVRQAVHQRLRAAVPGVRPEEFLRSALPVGADLGAPPSRW